MRLFYHTLPYVAKEKEVIYSFKSARIYESGKSE
jgi:hypothetical protein